LISIEVGGQILEGNDSRILLFVVRPGIRILSDGSEVQQEVGVGKQKRIELRVDIVLEVQFVPEKLLLVL